MRALYYLLMFGGLAVTSWCGAAISVRTGVSGIYFAGFFLGTFMVALSCLAPIGATIQELRSRIQKLEAGKAETA